MEVHHHGHHEGKKNWKSYLWEFLMLFLAVFCGFLAEYQLEHTIEHQREKEYIISMIEDAKTDMANIEKSIRVNTLRANRLDTLALLCLNYDATMNYDIHRFFRYGLIHPDFITPTERTIQQLKNAGGMRLLRKKDAINSIVQYDDIAKKLINQQAFYELYQNKSIDAGSKVINFENLKLGSLQFRNTSGKLSNTDNLKLIEFGNMVYMYSGVVKFYVTRLKDTNGQAVRLTETLEKEYDLDAK